MGREVVTLSKAQLRALERAVEQHETASKALNDAVAAAFPVGCIVTVNLGRQPFQMRVICHGHGRGDCSLGDVFGENIVTGTRRRAHYTMVDPIYIGAEP